MVDMLSTAEAIGASLDRFPTHYSPFFQASIQKISGAEGFRDRFDEHFLKSCNLTLRLDDTLFGALLAAARTIRDNPNLLRWAGFYHYLLYDTKVIRENPWQFSFPVPSNEVLGPARDLFILMAQISGMDRSVEKYRLIDTADPIIRDTYLDVRLGLEWFHKHFGRYGFRNHAWLTYHAHTRIFRLGRFEYIAGQFRGDVEVYRHRTTGALLTLAQDRAIFAADGLRVSTEEEERLKKKLAESTVFERKKVLPAGYWMTDHDRENVWLRRGQTDIVTRIQDDGTAVRETASIDWDLYDRILGAQSPVLTLSIPAGEPLTIQSAEDSLYKALLFFGRKRFGTHFDSFVTRGWVMDPQFDIILSRPSNIRDFQELFHLYPVPREEHSGLRAIYGPHFARDLPQDWAQDTRLQRQLIKVRSQGYHHTEGGGYILRDELIQRFVDEGRLDLKQLPEQREAHVRPVNDAGKRQEKTELSG